MANIAKLDFTAEEINEKLGKITDPIEVVQETGDSETAVMSQKAVTNALVNAGGNVKLYRHKVNVFITDNYDMNGGFVIEIINSSPNYIEDIQSIYPYLPANVPFVFWGETYTQYFIYKIYSKIYNDGAEKLMLEGYQMLNPDFIEAIAISEGMSTMNDIVEIRVSDTITEV